MVPGNDIQLVDPLIAPEWDAVLDTFVDATPFHTSSWARVLAETYRFTPVYIASAESRQAGFVVPMMEVRALSGSRRGVSLPFSDECGPLTRTRDDVERALAGIQVMASRRGWSSYEIRRLPYTANEGAPASRFHGHTLDLASAFAATAARFHPSIRQGHRKAVRDGLRAEIRTDSRCLDTFYRLQGETRRRHGLPPQPYLLFEQIQREFTARGAAFTSLVMSGDQPLAAVLFLVHKRRAIYKFGASTTRTDPGRASTLAMWEAIRHCHECGVETVDFGRTDLQNEGLRTYKLRWGTVERVICYARFDRTGKPLPARRVRVHGWHNHIFRHLPPPLSRLIGTILYRFMG